MHDPRMSPSLPHLSRSCYLFLSHGRAWQSRVASPSERQFSSLASCFLALPARQARPGSHQSALSSLHNVSYHLRRHLQQWDQAAWNEVILGFLVGMGYEEPLRYRILPVDQFSNIGTLFLPETGSAAPCVLVVAFRAHSHVQLLQLQLLLIALFV